MISNQEYGKIVEKVSPNSKCLQNCVKAFLFGGGICLAGQIIYTVYTSLELTKDVSKTLTSARRSGNPCSDNRLCERGFLSGD